MLVSNEVNYGRRADENRQIQLYISNTDRVQRAQLDSRPLCMQSLIALWAPGKLTAFVRMRFAERALEFVFARSRLHWKGKYVCV
jgi:hypothetical protein